MKLSFSPYKLKPHTSLNAVSEAAAREGALFKIEWSDGLTGYGDLHPWTLLGDSSLDEQLNGLRAGKISSQMEQTIWLAHRDAEARAAKKNLFDTGSPVRNNYLITHFDELEEGLLDSIKKEGFTTVKLKVGRDIKAEQATLVHIAAAGLKMRLDFNAVTSWQVFERFVKSLDPEVLAYIEYIEDPFPYEPSAWQEARSLVKIAMDNQLHKVRWDQMQQCPFDVLIIKPAKMDIMKAVDHCRQWNLKATVTSYMDHPVGVAHALILAMQLKRDCGDMILESGCLTHRLYGMDAFSAELETRGPFVRKVPGTGIGFNDLLESLSWQPISLR